MNHGSISSANTRALICGEALFDTFPDGAELPGGAAFNVAWHLCGFGADPLLITRVGNDTAGQRMQKLMRDWGLDMQAVQTDDEYQTGAVTVELDNGQPSFTILPVQAYDFIEHESALHVLERGTFSLLYHGTLIARTSASFEVVTALRETSGLPVFVDINLRSPWWSGEVVESTLQGARWGKMNLAELGEVVNDPALSDARIEDAARELCQRYDLEFLAITLGAEGACIATQTAFTRAPAPSVEMVDTVGAGDAFSAVILLGLSRGWSTGSILQRATEFASAICSVPGAVSQDADLYATYRARWAL